MISNDRMLKRLLDEAIAIGQEAEKELERRANAMVEMQDRITTLERHCSRVADVVTGNKVGSPHGQDEWGPAMQAMPGKPFVSTLERDALKLLRKLVANSDVVPSRM